MEGKYPRGGGKRAGLENKNATNEAKLKSRDSEVVADAEFANMAIRKECSLHDISGHGEQGDDRFHKPAAEDWERRGGIEEGIFPRGTLTAKRPGQGRRLSATFRSFPL